MLRHAVETGNQFSPSFSRFYLVHLPGKLLLDTFPQSYIVGTDNIAKEINAFFYREYPFIRLYFQVYFSHLPVNSITNLPQFRFRFTEYQSVIAIAIVITNPVLILQIVV